jgi:hypothetical protein
METVGYRMTQRLADKIFTQAGASRDDVGVVELHDCFAANEASHLRFNPTELGLTFFFAQLVTYPALGLCAFDEAHRFVERGDNTVRRIHLRTHRFTHTCIDSTEGSMWSIRVVDSRPRDILLVPRAWQCTSRSQVTLLCPSFPKPPIDALTLSVQLRNCKDIAPDVFMFAEVQQGPVLCRLQVYLTFPTLGGSTASYITSGSAAQSLSASSVAQNFTTLTATMDATGRSRHFLVFTFCHLALSQIRV